jgi:hypothetical protein
MEIFVILIRHKKPEFNMKNNKTQNMFVQTFGCEEIREV